MRFLILTQYFPPEIGAPQVRLAAFARELRRLGHEVEVVTTLPNYPSGRIFPEYQKTWYCRETWEGMAVHRVWVYASVGAGLKRILNYLSFAFTCLFGLVRARRPDYVFVESPPLFLSLPGALAAALWRVPLIFNVADLWPDSIRELGLMSDGFLLRLAEWLERWTYRRATYVNAVTEGIRATLLRKGVPAAKILFLPNGVDTQSFRPQPAEVELLRRHGWDGELIILYAGTHGYAHGLEVALHAAKLLEGESLRFVLVGDGSEKARLKVMARDGSLTNVTFLDAVPPEEVARLYGVALAGLSTLRRAELFEGTRPVKMLAAMACGKPVLYSGEGEGARLIREAEAGIVVPPEDPEALAGAVRMLLNDPEKGAEMGANGRRYVEAHLSWSVLVQDWLSDLSQGEWRLESK